MKQALLQGEELTREVEWMKNCLRPFMLSKPVEYYILNQFGENGTEYEQLIHLENRIKQNWRLMCDLK